MTYSDKDRQYKDRQNELRRAKRARETPEERQERLDKFRTYLRGWRETHPDYDRELYRKRKEREPLWRVKRHGITPDDYRAMVALQENRCAICGDDQTDKRLHIDHDHSCCSMVNKEQRSCGKCIRGLLCGSCNIALGNFRDDPELLDRAAKYLRSWREGNGVLRSVHANRTQASPAVDQGTAQAATVGYPHRI